MTVSVSAPVYNEVDSVDRKDHAWTGLLPSRIAAPIGAWALGLKFVDGTSFIQTPLPLLVVLLAIAGFLSIMLGLLAEMLMRICFESRGRPPYSVRAVRNFDRD
jgi:dolichol-phosphate mannosyltransferase